MATEKGSDFDNMTNLTEALVSLGFQLMAPRPRLFPPGLLYRVIVRGNQRQKTFIQPADTGAGTL
jgi:hypothetical protein